jgi:hypothetical protein
MGRTFGVALDSVVLGHRRDRREEPQDGTAGDGTLVVPAVWESLSKAISTLFGPAFAPIARRGREVGQVYA